MTAKENSKNQSSTKKNTVIINDYDIVVESINRVGKFKNDVTECITKFEEDGWTLTGRELSANGALCAILHFKKEVEA